MPHPIKLYMDENVSKPIAEGLRHRGIDVLTAQEADMLGRSDDVQLNFFTREGWVIFTHASDFLRLHSTAIAHKGIVYAHQSERLSVV